MNAKLLEFGAFVLAKKAALNCSSLNCAKGSSDPDEFLAAAGGSAFEFDAVHDHDPVES